MFERLPSGTRADVTTLVLRTESEPPMHEFFVEHRPQDAYPLRVYPLFLRWDIDFYSHRLSDTEQIFGAIRAGISTNDDELLAQVLLRDGESPLWLTAATPTPRGIVIMEVLGYLTELGSGTAEVHDLLCEDEPAASDGVLHLTDARLLRDELVFSEEEVAVHAQHSWHSTSDGRVVARFLGWPAEGDTDEGVTSWAGLLVDELEDEHFSVFITDRELRDRMTGRTMTQWAQGRPGVQKLVDAICGRSTKVSS